MKSMKFIIPAIAVFAVFGFFAVNGGGAEMRTAEAQTATGTATLIITKNVVNNASSSFVPNDFFIGIGTVAGNQLGTSSIRGSATGTAVTITAPSTYAVAEATIAGINATYSANCSGTILPNQTVNCTVTNTILAGSIPTIPTTPPVITPPVVNVPNTGTGTAPFLPIAVAMIVLGGTGLVLARRFA